LQLSAVGGDWYDYVELGDGFWGIALGDVCGKGMAAALLMSATRSLFRRAAEGLESPSEVLTRLNRSLLKDLPEGRFVTLVYSILDTKRATMRVANGGHTYPIFVREQTNITELQTDKGLPLGLMKSEYSEIELTLQTGDRVLMYTDGAAEAANLGSEEYGTSRLVKSLQKPSATAQSVLTEVQDFASGGTLSDDATAIVLRR
jgi:sigma-B regulation protein RsbU (phosphoserine phosphatase)